MDYPTRTDLFGIGAAFVQARAKKIDPSTIYVLGSDVNIVLGSTSVVGYQLVKQLGYRIGTLLLDGCESNEDLDRYAWDRYQLIRKGASAALGTVRFYRASFALGAGTIPANTVIKTASGITYVTTTAATFGAGTLDNVTAFVRATQAGKSTQVGANLLQSFGNPSQLFDPTIQVNNDATTAGGEDAEDNDTFKNRIRNFWLNARRGVLTAIVQGATSVAGVVSATAIEALTPGAQPARVVNLYIADSSGVASQALATLVQNSLMDYRAAGITVLVFTSIPQLVSIQLLLAFIPGSDTTNLKTLALGAVVGFVNSLPTSGTLTRAALESVLQRYTSDGLIVNQNTIVSPAGDIVPSVGQTLRTTPALVTSN